MVRSRSFLLPLCLGWLLLEDDALELALELALEEGGRDDCLELAILPPPILEGTLLPAPPPSELVLLRGDTPASTCAKGKRGDAHKSLNLATFCIHRTLAFVEKVGLHVIHEIK